MTLIFCFDGGFTPLVNAHAVLTARSVRPPPASLICASPRRREIMFKDEKVVPNFVNSERLGCERYIILKPLTVSKLNTFKVKNALLHKNFYVAFSNRAPRQAAWLPALIIRGRATGPATASINH